MTTAEIFFYLGCAILIIVPSWFIAHRVYDDGIVGRIALSAIILAAVAIVAQAMAGYFDAWWASPAWPAFRGADYSDAGYNVAREEAALVMAFAVFITWHLWRFHRRVVRQTRQATPPRTPAAQPVIRIRPDTISPQALREPMEDRQDLRSRARA